MPCLNQIDLRNQKKDQFDKLTSFIEGEACCSEALSLASAIGKGANETEFGAFGGEGQR